MNCPACDHENVDGARYCAKCGALMPVAQAGDDDPLINSVVGGRYRITSLLGEGGMGRVYIGEQQMGTAVRKVAVKTLLQEFSKDPQVIARFMRECGTVVELEHPNTIKFYDFGQTDEGDLYIAMEYVDGAPLSEDIEKNGAMSFERVDKIMKQICGSLQEAHDIGIVHRDLKPENVILTTRAGETDFVKVLDFGIAKRHDASDTAQEQKLTQAGMVLGTPPYMSPEQFTGKELDCRSDIYSLGVMAYEMLTSQLPFEANTAWEWATKHMTEQPCPFEQTGPMASQIPPHMQAAIMRALSKKQEKRQDTAKEFYKELNAAAGPAAAVAPAVAAVTAGAAGATEAFTAPPAAGAAGAARPGGTQIGEPFIQPAYAMGGPPAAGPPPSPAMGAAGAAAQNVPAAGGQAVPAAPRASRGGGGGGGKGLYIAGAGVLAAGLVVGIVFAVSSGDDDDETDEEPLIPVTTVEPAGGSEGGSGLGSAGGAAPDTTAAGGATPETTATAPPTATATKTTTKTTTKPPDGTASCNAAITHALAKRCSQARSAMYKCSGPKKGTALANVNANCKKRIILRPKK